MRWSLLAGYIIALKFQEGILKSGLFARAKSSSAFRPTYDTDDYEYSFPLETHSSVVSQQSNMNNTGKRCCRSLDVLVCVPVYPGFCVLSLFNRALTHLPILLSAVFLTPPPLPTIDNSCSIYWRSKYHTQLAKMSLDEILDLTADVFFKFILEYVCGFFFSHLFPVVDVFILYDLILMHRPLFLSQPFLCIVLFVSYTCVNHPAPVPNGVRCRWLNGQGKQQITPLPPFSIDSGSTWRPHDKRARAQVFHQLHKML